MDLYRGPVAQAYIERDAKVVSPSYTRGYPFVMQRGLGTEVWDVDGYRYLDFSSGVAVTATGHSHPEVVKAIAGQAQKFLHMSGTDFYYPVQIELAEALSEIAPMEKSVKVFFTNSGTESIEAAIKLARYATKRPYLLAFYGAFHGRSMGALALTASKTIHRQGFLPVNPAVIHVPFPDPFRPFFCSHDGDEGLAVIRFIEEMVFARKVAPDEVAAIVVEPIQGEGGYVVPPPSFFPALRNICDKYGILLIVDEIQSGMGRTGQWFAIEYEGIEPDIVATAKGIASGMPLGAMIARDSLMTWPSGSHASTFGGNPVCCAAALATIRLLREGMIENARVKGHYLMNRLKEIARSFNVIGDVRGRGLMIGVEIVQNRGTNERAPELRNAIVSAAFHQGLLLLGAGPNTIRFIPPLNVSRDHLDEALSIFTNLMSDLGKP